MIGEIVRVVQAMMEHHILPDIRAAASPFQLSTFSQQGSVHPAPSLVLKMVQAIGLVLVDVGYWPTYGCYRFCIIYR
ncbi:hypothetical protein Dimus_033154 [Dionaea muscipula]